jgi:hypothetical protein
MSLSVPWYIWSIVAGIASGTIGGVWDISWHMSIGRDTFWTPAHIMIQMTGVLVGIACGYLILAATFSHDAPSQSIAVRIWGFRGPLGAFIAVWGCIAMLTSAPFDNWWHNAYGLDVKIISPPHALLSAGSFGIKFGALMLIASAMNHALPALRVKLEWLYLFVGMTFVGQTLLFITEPTWPVFMHSANCYLAIAIAVPGALIGIGWGAARRWACTLLAAMYMMLSLAFEWILPLFPAQPKLGPVYHDVTHFIPLHFPLLVIVPAFVVDLILQKWPQVEKMTGRWTLAAFTGGAFLLSFIAVQWPFANFLMSPAARNRFFGMAYFAYFDPAGFNYNPYQFAVLETTGAKFFGVLAIALTVSILNARIGLAWGDWMRRIRR